MRGYTARLMIVIFVVDLRPVGEWVGSRDPQSKWLFFSVIEKSICFLFQIKMPNTTCFVCCVLFLRNLKQNVTQVRSYLATDGGPRMVT